MSRAARASLIASLAILFVGLATFAGALWWTRPPANEAAPSALGGPFTLVDQDGRAVDERALIGRPSLLFFGFTHCPDICPTKLFELSQVMQALGRDGDRLGVFFVSVDPERDTPELMKLYLSSFDARFRGLTGTPEQVAAMTRAWRVYHRRVPLDGGGYTVDHGTAVYLIDRAGRFVSTLDLSGGPDRAAARLRTML
jgi:protein SCO1